MEFYVTCPFCGEHVYGVNAGDIVNNLRIHFEGECAENPESFRAREAAMLKSGGHYG